LYRSKEECKRRAIPAGNFIAFLRFYPETDAMRQWHPIFASLLRPVVEPYYELRTDVPVGEAPRKADIALLRRVSRGSLPFRTLWRFLTPWNVLEFKGPSVSPRHRDIDRLIELGLGIDRRLNEERSKDGLRILDRSEVSFWYICNHVGRRLLRKAGGVAAWTETR
jgi:hypothetical protein